MIERLLAAEAALSRGELDQAEKLFGQVADADARNAIAAVGLGRVAAGRDDAEAARAWFLRALEIDPDEAAARRLLTALDREVPPVAAAPALARDPAPAPAGPATAPAVPSASVPRAGKRSLLDRIRGWFGVSKPRA